MEQDKQKGKDNTIAHLRQGRESDKTDTYDPDRLENIGSDFQEGVPLEDKEPDKGYSTDARQGKESASLHLADEDMDRRPPDPAAKARNLKESYQKSKENSDVEKAKEELRNEKKE